jgi:glycosyltransferase involved in cell wall biosynthesis
MPRVSVLLPVRDALPYLVASLRSLARQSYSDFEIVAVDDGSRDGSGAALDRAAALEPRLRVVHTAPLGLPAALNAALAHSRGELIARHDADDLSHRDRFARQVEYLATHRAIAAVGTRVRLFPPGATGAGMRRWAEWHNALLTHEAMARDALIESPLGHGTAIIRREPLERVGGWNERGWAEDSDLWLRLIEAGERLAKLPHVLYAWRQHPASATRRDPRYGRDAFDRLKCAALERGLLRGARAVTLIGPGASLARWCVHLSQTGRALTAIDARRPGAVMLDGVRPPLVLVFGAHAARSRWRNALAAGPLCEGREFVFVS